MDGFLKNQIFAAHAVAGGGSVALATALTYPLDSVKVLVQVGSSPGKVLTPFQALNRILSISGVSGLYSGLGWSISGRILGVGMRFGVYEILTAFYKDGREDNHVHVSEAILAGSAAGMMEALCSSPFELIKLRSQVTSASLIPRLSIISENRVIASMIDKLLRGYSPNMKALNYSVGLLSTLPVKNCNLAAALQEYPWMMTGSGRPPSVCDVRSLSNIISLEGWGAIWRGLRSGVVRDSVFGGIFFGSWQFLHTAMLNWKAVGMNPPPRFDEEIGPLPPFGVSVAAGISGSIAASASHFCDTAKSRSLCTVLPKYIIMERKMLKWKRPGDWFERLTGIHPSDRKLLFHGVWLQMARSGVASFMIVGAYYMAVNYLVS